MKPSLLAVLLSCSAAAADAPKKPFSAGFIGEGGGYKASDRATDDYLQGGLGGEAKDAPAPAPVPEKISPDPKPATAAPRVTSPARSVSAAPRAVSPRTDAPSRPSSARPAAEGGNASVPGESRPAASPSLWNGRVRPLDGAASQAAASSDLDAARADSERDYETRILGMKDAPARPSLGTPEPAAPSDAASVASASAPQGESKVFVSLELDPREAGSLRDAVAGLGAATGFAADARFETMAGPGGTALISGWIPAARLGDALSRPGVKRLRVETHARPSTPLETSAEFVVGLRVEDAARARESVDAGVRALTENAGFHLTRIVGLETAPDGRTVAVVAGRLPLARLSRAMGLPAVAKISPLGAEAPAPAAAPESGSAPSLTGFARFAVERGPWLIIVTLLLALPSLRGLVRRLASVFSPYR